MEKNLSLMGKYFLYTGYVLPLSVLSQSEVIRRISDFSFFQQPSFLETAGHGVKRTKIGPLR